jgi:hypothetical protein
MVQVALLYEQTIRHSTTKVPQKDVVGSFENSIHVSEPACVKWTG